MKFFLYNIVILLILLSCITVDESGRIISGPKFLIKNRNIKKWQLKEVPLGPRWTEKEKEIPILITPRNYEMPEKLILNDLPPVMNQGRQASSTAFATGYLALSYFYQQFKYKKNYYCSPAFVYNLLNNGKDQGIEIIDALYLLKNSGCPPITLMPYKEFDYKIQPTPYIVKIAGEYKIQNFARIDPLDIYQIATFLYNKKVIITTLFITENFLNLDKDYYEPEGKFLGKHTVGIVGYDLKKRRYYIQNSAGKDWGDDGFTWLSEEWYKRLVVSAYVILD
ncbi:MAG: hypothetical protein KatS3mg129_1241 [Leptospiraceae bacterium]|nr:MAG: hypothetical protein KatS3mg129_1241 [Leptospiraceae bacterium]